MIAAAFSISSLSIHFLPQQNHLFQLLSIPISAAFDFNESADIYVWAIPVGQAVTATINCFLPAPGYKPVLLLFPLGE